MTIVFVHGIFSDCEVFTKLRMQFQADFPRVGIWDFNYDFLEKIEANGLKLAEKLEHLDECGEQDIIIVAHSMGGLVARAALLQVKCPITAVKFLFMLATPNHGAIRLSQLKAAEALMLESGQRLKTISSRAAGLVDLTKVNTVFRDLILKHDGCVNLMSHVVYVTIPAIYYDGDRPYTALRFWKNPTGWFLNRLSKGSSRGGNIRLKLPHDGVVEERSVKLVNDPEFSVNERDPFRNHAFVTVNDQIVYMHANHGHFMRLVNHIDIHQSDWLAQFVVRIISTGTIEGFMNSLTSADSPGLYLEFI